VPSKRVYAARNTVCINTALASNGIRSRKFEVRSTTLQSLSYWTLTLSRAAYCTNNGYVKHCDFVQKCWRDRISFNYILTAGLQNRPQIALKLGEIFIFATIRSVEHREDDSSLRNCSVCSYADICTSHIRSTKTICYISSVFGQREHFIQENINILSLSNLGPVQSNHFLLFISMFVNLSLCQYFLIIFLTKTVLTINNSDKAMNKAQLNKRMNRSR
jgi:hypothetical protein